MKIFKFSDFQIFKSSPAFLNMKPLFYSVFCILYAGVYGGLAPALAEDWPQWGRTTYGRNMYSLEKGLPARFDPGKFKPGTEDVDLKTTKNVKWVAKLGSQSYGNATIAGGKVFVGTNNDTPRDPQHQGDRSILMVFD